MLIRLIVLIFSGIVSHLENKIVIFKQEIESLGNMSSWAQT